MNRIGMVLVALALTLPLGAQGTRSATHRGFWIGFGLGGGSNLSEGYAGTRGGGAAYLRIGGTVNQQLLIGGETISWVRAESGTTVSTGNTTAVVSFYPSRRGGLFLKSGLGVANSLVSTTISLGNSTTTTTISDVGFGVTFGGGYDVQAGNNFFVTPNLDFLIQTIEGTTRTIIVLTVGATWH